MESFNCNIFDETESYDHNWKHHIYRTVHTFGFH